MKKIVINVQTGERKEIDLTPDEIAALQPTQAQLAEITKAEMDRKDEDSVKADAWVQQFVAMTPAEVANYVDNNVSNLADARILLKRMAVMLLLLARRAYR